MRSAPRRCVLVGGLAAALVLPAGIGAAAFGPAAGPAAAAPTVTCPASAPAVLPAVDTKPVLAPKPLAVSYGRLPLTFTRTATTAGAACTLVSNRGALPVFLNVYADPSRKVLLASPHVADSVTTATLDFSFGPKQAPVCDFSKAPSLTSPGVDTCFLDKPGKRSGDVVLTWRIPGFVEYAPDQHGVPIYSTRALTYFVDLTSLGLPHPTDAGASVQPAETYIHTTLISHLPSVDRIGILQDPPAHLVVTPPAGTVFGYGVPGVAGAGYVEAGGRSIAWLLHPPAGTYAVQAIGTPGAHFSIGAALLPVVGTARTPTATTAGTLPASGTTTLTFNPLTSTLAR